MDQNLAGLMSATQGGDKAQYHVLIKTIQPILYRFIAKRISQPDAIQDVVQTVLLKIHMSRQNYDPAQPFEPWMYGIARHTLNDYFKSESKQGKITNFYGLMEEPVEKNSWLELIAIRDAIQELNADQRVALKLLRFTGLSLEEAAKKAGVSISALKVRAHRAQQAVLKALENEE